MTDSTENLEESTVCVSATELRSRILGDVADLFLKIFMFLPEYLIKPEKRAEEFEMMSFVAWLSQQPETETIDVVEDLFDDPKGLLSTDLRMRAEFRIVVHMLFEMGFADLKTGPADRFDYCFAPSLPRNGEPREAHYIGINFSIKGRPGIKYTVARKSGLRSKLNAARAVAADAQELAEPILDDILKAFPGLLAALEAQRKSSSD